MSRSIQVDVIYGFNTTVELSRDDISDLEKAGVTVSPMLYTTEDNTDQYIVGKYVDSLSSAGEYSSFDFSPSDAEKAKIKADILKSLNELGFDVKEKEFKLWINTYYA